ncbi:hypothetical protein SLA2020_174640 [Shorea laevis]
MQSNPPLFSVINDEHYEKVKPPFVWQRGRSKVTSENVDLERVGPLPLLQKSHSMQDLKFLEIHTSYTLETRVCAYPFILVYLMADNCLFFILFPTSPTILQTNTLQRQISVADHAANCPIDGGSSLPITVFGEKSLLEAVHDREMELLHEITNLQTYSGGLYVPKMKSESTKPKMLR